LELVRKKKLRGGDPIFGDYPDISELLRREGKEQSKRGN